MKRWFKVIALVALVAVLISGAAFAVLPLPVTVPVLMYHFIGSEDDAAASTLFVSRESFRRQMDFLARSGFHVISLDQFYAIKTGQRKPRGKEVVITFDDGSTSFEKEAFPILKPHAFPVTLFLISEHVKDASGGSMSRESIQSLLKNPWIGIGGHTKTHPALSKLREEWIADELTGSKKDLEAMFGVPVSYLAYPGGDFDGLVMEVAKKSGYRYAFTTSPKKLKKHKEGPYCLTRIKISQVADNPVVFWFQVSGIYQFFKQTGQKFKTRTGQA